MQSRDFEWDDAKARRNFAKHNVSFDLATKTFADPFSVDLLDDREDYGEERYNIVGMVEGRLLFVAYIIREGVIRIISARGAEPHERRQYHEENR